MNWKLHSISTEAVRNVIADSGRTVAHITAWTLIVAAVVIAELATSTNLAAEANQRDQDGINILISTSQSGIDAASCAEVDTHSHVRAAGGITNTRTTNAERFPKIDFVSAHLTNRAINILDSTLNTESFMKEPGMAILGEALAAELGLGAGEEIRIEGRSLTIAGILKPNTRNDKVSRWLLTSAPPAAPLEECWIEFEPHATNHRFELAATALTTPGNEVLESRELIRIDSRTRNITKEFKDRQLTTGWLAASAIGLITTIGILWSRRSELALYRTVGLSNTRVVLLIQLEFAIILMVSALLGTLLAAAVLPLVSNNSVEPYSLEQLRIAVRTVGLTTSFAYLLAPFFVTAFGRDTMTLLKAR